MTIPQIVLNLRLPTSMHQQLRVLAEQEGVSINQFVTLAISEKIAIINTQTYLQERARRGSRARLLAILAQAPDVEPDAADQWPARH
ncbi:MAG: toxin-antitoxin system HicB family antitoxin [Anaerolineae bacterium]|uniref:toxin-antitoxin system HicB family antitoxin n=1 Tax=Chloroflexota TaxID=200795 RepID=UPI0031CC6883